MQKCTADNVSSRIDPSYCNDEIFTIRASDYQIWPRMVICFTNPQHRSECMTEIDLHLYLLSRSSLEIYSFGLDAATGHRDSSWLLLQLRTNDVEDNFAQQMNHKCSDMLRLSERLTV